MLRDISNGRLRGSRIYSWSATVEPTRPSRSPLAPTWWSGCAGTDEPAAWPPFSTTGPAMGDDADVTGRHTCLYELRPYRTDYGSCHTPSLSTSFWASVSRALSGTAAAGGDGPALNTDDRMPCTRSEGSHRQRTAQPTLACAASAPAPRSPRWGRRDRPRQASAGRLSWRSLDASRPRVGRIPAPDICVGAASRRSSVWSAGSRISPFTIRVCSTKRAAMAAHAARMP